VSRGTQKEWFSATEVATALGVGKARVITQIRSGKLPGIDLNKDNPDPKVKPQFRVHKDDLQRYIESLRVADTAKPKRIRRAREPVKNHFG
jgi:hypothetical protein